MDPGFEAAHQTLGVILDVLQNVGHGFAIDVLSIVYPSAFTEIWMAFSIAKEVVHIAQDFLICTNEEDTYIIMLALPHIVERNVARLMSVVNIADDFPVLSQVIS